LNKYTNSCNWK